MKRFLPCAVAMAFLGLAAIPKAQPTADGPFSVTVVGLQVVCEVTARDERGGLMSPFSSQKGTGLALLVESADRNIVGLDASGSELTSIQDDTGAQLLSQNRDRWVTFFPPPPISADHGGMLIEVRGGKTPSKGSSRIGAQGTLSVVVGKELKEERANAVPLEKGSKITAGPFVLTIEKVQHRGGDEAPGAGPDEAAPPADDTGAGGVPATIAAPADLGQMTEDLDRLLDMNMRSQIWSVGGARTEVKLSVRQVPDEIASIRFYDADGNEVETVYRTSGYDMPTRASEPRMFTYEWGFDQELDTADIVVEYWEGLDHVQVPFSVQAGLSLE